MRKFTLPLKMIKHFEILILIIILSCVIACLDCERLKLAVTDSKFKYVFEVGIDGHEIMKLKSKSKLRPKCTMKIES